jgi:DNA-binding transcriptional LysR family regulator
MQQVSEVMHTSIASVSQQLNLLEQDTNLKLFEKVGRRVQLTHEGHALVKKVRPVINQLEDIENALKDKSEDIQGTVRIAAFTSALEKIVIPAASKLSKEHPKLEIQLTELEPDKSIPAIDAYQFDIAVVAYTEKTHLLEKNYREVIKLGSDKLKVLVSDKNPLAKHAQISIEQLEKENWVLEPDGTYLSNHTKKLCVSAGFEPNVINVVQNYLTMHLLIAENLAVGILPELAIIKSMKNVCVLDLKSDESRDIYLVARKSTTTTRAMQIVTKALSNKELILSTIGTRF